MEFTTALEFKISSQQQEQENQRRKVEEDKNGKVRGKNARLFRAATAEHLMDKAGCSFSLPKPAKTDFILNLILHILIRI